MIDNRIGLCDEHLAEAQSKFSEQDWMQRFIKVDQAHCTVCVRALELALATKKLADTAAIKAEARSAGQLPSRQLTRHRQRGWSKARSTLRITLTILEDDGKITRTITRNFTRPKAENDALYETVVEQLNALKARGEDKADVT